MYTVADVLDFRSEAWWFKAQSLPLCCFQKLYPTLSLSTQVYKMSTGDILLGLTLQWASIPSVAGGEGGGLVAILSVASCYRNWVELRLCGPPWLVSDFTLPTFYVMKT